MNMTSSTPKRPSWIVPFGACVLFITAVEGLSLSEYLPVPVAVLAAAAWGAAIGLTAVWIRKWTTLSAWVEDILVALGTIAMALFAFGGFAGLLLIGAAMDSPSLTGETLVTMFLPSIPVAIVANVPTELLVIPALLILGWRRGPRRVLIVGAAGLYFVHRVWTYLVFASDRLDFTATERSTTPLTTIERQQLAAGLHLDDPRWMLNLLIFGVFLLAAHFSRVRHLKLTEGSRQRGDGSL